VNGAVVEDEGAAGASLLDENHSFDLWCRVRLIWWGVLRWLGRRRPGTSGKVRGGAVGVRQQSFSIQWARG